jgi:Flp pilus assembly protein TadD
MSLIHDALKKAGEAAKEKNGKPAAEIGSGILAMGDVARATNRVIPKRTIVLASVLIVAVSIFAYMKLKSGPAIPATLTPTASQTASGLQQQSDTQDVGVLKTRALAAYAKSDFDSAWNDMLSASVLAPIDPEIWNNLGLIAKSRGDAIEAQRNYDKALELRPDYPEALNNLGMLVMQEGNNTRAIELIGKSLKLMPAYPEANFNMAFLYDKKGEHSKAANYYRRFIEVGGNYPSNVIDAVRGRLMEIEK